MIAFTVHGSPIAQPRQRHRVVAAHGRIFATNYTPAKAPVNQWKSDVKMAAVNALPNPGAASMLSLYRGPAWIHIWLYLPRPASKSRKKDPDGSIPCTSKPDIDNCYKAIADALTGVLVADDRQFCEIQVRKYYAEKDGRPRAEIKIGVMS